MIKVANKKQVKNLSDYQIANFCTFLLCFTKHFQECKLMPPNRTRRRRLVRWFRSTSHRSWRKIRRSANLGTRSRKKFRKINLAAFAIDGRRTYQIRTRNTHYDWRRWSYSFFWLLAMPENCLFCLWLWNKVTNCDIITV